MNLIDLTGQRFGRLLVERRLPSRNSKVIWLCRCDCGNTHEVVASSLKRKTRPTRSCGCLEQERRIDRASTDPACQRPTTRYPNGRTGTAAGYLAHYHMDEPACAACLAGVRRENAAKHAADADKALRMTLWSKYRLTLERYMEILTAQGGQCAICTTDSPRDIRAGRFHVDHDHACCPGTNSCGNCIRGLLCAGCNTGLGNFGDSQARLLRAAEYLDNWPGTRPVTGLRPRTTRKAARHGAEGTMAS